jgi:hypothetical protein
MTMLWSNKRIEEYVDGFRASDDDSYLWWQAQMQGVMSIVRDEYEARIAELEAQNERLRQEEVDRKYIEREIARGTSGGMLY